MPRYHFHTSNGVAYPDVEGQELPDEDAARAVAVTALGELLRDLGGQFWDTPFVEVSVADGRGLTLFTVTALGMNAPATRR